MSRQPDAFVHSAVFIRDLELLHPKPMQLVWKGKVLFYTSHHASGRGGPFCVRSWNRQNQMKEAGTSIPLPWQNQKRTCRRTPQRRTQTIPEGLSCDILYAVTRAEPGNMQPQRSMAPALLCARGCCPSAPAWPCAGCYDSCWKLLCQCTLSVSSGIEDAVLFWIF